MAKNEDDEIETTPNTITLTVGELATVYGVNWLILHRYRSTPGCVKEVAAVQNQIVKPKLNPELIGELELTLHRGEADDSFAAVRKLLGEVGVEVKGNE